MADVKQTIKCPECGEERRIPKRFVEQGIHLLCKSCANTKRHAKARAERFQDNGLEVGSVRFGPDIGIDDRRLYVLAACEDCGKQRWILKTEFAKRGTKRCLACHNKAKTQRTVSAILKAHPEIREIKWVATKGGKAGYYAVFVPCQKCGKVRWMALGNYKRTPSCATCCNVKPHDQIRRLRKDGYIRVAIASDSPYMSMATREGGQYTVLEHRLVMAESLGRPLEAYEEVHHNDGDRQNNRLSNLRLVSREDHMILNTLCADCPVRKEVGLLRLQLRELGLLSEE